MKYPRRTTFFRYTAALFLIVMFCGSWTVAQNSHLSNLIGVYKEQKTEHPADVLARQGQQPPPMPNMAAPSAGLLRDPHARPDDLINQPSPEPILTASAAALHDGSRNVPSVGGNPRDPLGGDFLPYLKPSSERPITAYDEMRSDARLHDVCFVDSRHGWAVGDRGAVWCTEDGGASWNFQETPVDCVLWSVCFLDKSFGMAVGGYSFPFSSRGRGVILVTRDGGRNWKALQTPDFPVLHYVRIVDPLKIFLAGESSERYPTGLFSSASGGQDWKPTSGGKNNGWISIDLLDDKNGFGIDRSGVIQMFKERTVVSRTPVFGTLRPAQVKMVRDAAPPGKINGWMVGSGGLILSTVDRGSRWGVVAGKLPGNQAAAVDLETVEARGTNLWVAGSPGTHIYSSTDLGKTWTSTPSGTSTTIRKIMFADDKNGWAVGDLGTILKTEDGGATWKPQRQGGKRLAVLGVFARAEDIPFEAFVTLCAQQGYLGAAALVFREQENTELESPRIHRIHEAMLRTGAVGVLEPGPFRLERSELLTDFNHLVRLIQEENDGKGMQRLRERLVAAIRQWRPDVILTAEVGKDKDPARELVLREIMEAVKTADDAKVFPYQLTELGLEPWKVKKVHVALENGAVGDVNLATTEPLIRIGISPDESAFVSRGLLETAGENRLQTAPALQGFLTPYSQVPSEGGRDLFAGISLDPGGEARRSLIGNCADRWEEIRQRIQQRRHVSGIVRKIGRVAEENGRQPSDVRLASNAAELIRKVDRDAAVRMLLEIGQKYHNEGDWESACEAYEIVARQYSQHPLARSAFLWLLQYQGGEEPGWRKHSQSVVRDVQTAFNKDRTASVSTFGAPSMNRHKLDPRLDKALALGKYMNEHLPDLVEDAPIRFSLASSLRRRGNTAEALKYYRQRGRLENDDIWGMRARTELWLTLEDRSELPSAQQELPMPSLICSFTGRKPWLDGLFDRDPNRDNGTWFGSKLFTLTPEKPRRRLLEMLKGQTHGGAGLKREEEAKKTSKNFGTRVMFLYDQEYLYIGIRCPRAAGFSYPPFAEKPRARDVPLDDQDRVEILLDVDRDYGTAYSVTIDSRGWVIDACWGDRTWDPEFSVARHEDKESWYIEAALSLSSLTDVPPMPGTVWNVGLRRIVPGVGIECWNAENSFDLTEGFGPLLFE